MKTDKRAFATFAMLGGYVFYHMLSEAAAWHMAFDRVEPIIKGYVTQVPTEELKKIEEQRAMEILHPAKAG
jgi:hypothetical protein